MRDAGEELILESLLPFDGDSDPSVIYSADLMLRYMPSLFELAKGPAPADVLVRDHVSWFPGPGYMIEKLFRV